MILGHILSSKVDWKVHGYAVKKAFTEMLFAESFNTKNSYDDLKLYRDCGFLVVGTTGNHA